MDEALTEHFGDIATWSLPEGGYFFWIKFDESIDTGILKGKAVGNKAGFQEGARFTNCGGLNNYLRLSFASYNEAEIKEGIGRIKEVFEQE